MRKREIAPEDRLLTPAEAGVILGVDPKAVTRWVYRGHLHPVRTPGGHRRYREVEVRALAAEIGGRP